MGDPSPPKPASTYSIGQGQAATNWFGTRTAHREASFILPYLHPTSTILDVGSGPASITRGFAALASQGTVTGVDLSAEAVSKAQNSAKDDGLTNLTFRTADIAHGLPFADNTFDVVFCHMVITHLADPAHALREMKRVAKKGGGVVAARELLEMHWYPRGKYASLETFLYWAGQAILLAGAKTELNARMLPSFAAEAGLADGFEYGNVSGQAYVTDKDKEEIFQVGRKFLLDDDAVLREGVLKAGLQLEQIEVMKRELEAWRGDPEGWVTWVSIESIWQV